MATVGKEFNFLQENFQFLHGFKSHLQTLYTDWRLRSAGQTANQLCSLNEQLTDFRSRVSQAREEKLPLINVYQYAEEDIVTMETNYSLLKELTDDKQKCMEMLMSITEIEEYYQTVSAEVDSRTLDLCAAPCREDEKPPSDGDRNTLSRHYNTCVYAVRSAWDWLIQEAKCQDVHLRNAAQYHQFYYEVKHYDQGIKNLLASVQRIDTKNDESNESHAQAKEIQEVLQELLDYQAKVEHLSARSVDIVPLYHRKYRAEKPIKVVALASYKQSDLTIVEGEEYLLLDNSEVTKWKVRSASGQEGLAPAIVFLIRPPDSIAVSSASRLRQQLYATWRDCTTLLKQNARTFFTRYLNTHSNKEIRCLTPSQRAEVIKCLTEIQRLLCTCDASQDEYKDLYNKTQDWCTVIEKMEGTSPDRRGWANTLILHWLGSKKLLRLLEELELYCQAYEEDLKSTRGTKNCFLMDKDGNVTYTSKAYVERLRPVDIDHLVPDELRSRLPGTPHVTMAEKVPVIPEDFGFQDQSVHSIIRFQNTCQASETDVECEQTIKETQTFVIVGVIDPRDGNQISIYRAIAEGIVSQTHGTYTNLRTSEVIPIPEAMARGLIQVEYTDKRVEAGELIRKGIIRTTTATNSVSLSVKGVTDPVTGRRISVEEAVKRGIIDQDQGRYVNPMTGDSMSLMEAVEQGLLDVKTMDDTSAANNNTKDLIDGYSNGCSLEGREVLVSGVRDPATGLYITLAEAMDRGIVDSQSGEYINPLTGQRMALADALQKGYLKAKLADLDSDKNNPNLLNFRLFTLQKGSTSLEALEDMLMSSTQTPNDLNYTIYSKIKDNLDTSQHGIREQITGQELTIQEAFERGVLNLDPLGIQNANGDKYSLKEAVGLGLIDPKTVETILKALEPYSLHRLIEDGLIDTRTGKYVDPDTKESMSLMEAVAREQIDPDRVFYVDVAAGSVSSLSSAFQNRKWDPASGLVFDARRAEEITLEDAIDDRVIDVKVDPEKFAGQMSALKFLQSHFDTNTKGVRNTRTGDVVSVEEAVMADILDVSRGQCLDLKAGRTVSIPEAVGEDITDTSTARRILGAMAQESLGAALDKRYIDPNTGTFTHPDSRRPLTLREAADQGFLDPAAIFLLDPQAGNVSSLDSYIKDGRFNPVTGKFKDPLSNLEVSIGTAAKKSIIEPSFNPDQLVGERSPLSVLTDSGKVNASKTTFVAPDGSEMPLKEAIKLGYVSPDSIVKTDPKTGKLSLSGNTEILKALIATTRQLQFVADVEDVLTKSEDVLDNEASVLHQIAEHDKLQSKCRQRQDAIKKTLVSAQSVLDTNKDTALKPGEQQQYQRLRFNTSDLKVRFEDVNTQLDNRLATLTEMLGDLQGFHDNVNNFEGWLADANREIDGVKTKTAGMEKLEELNKQIEELNERVQQKEGDVETLNRAGHRVQENKKNYDRLTEEYVQKVSGSKRRVKAAASPGADKKSLVEQELSAANEKFRGLLFDCTDLMTKLTETAAKNKLYNQLKAQLTKSLAEVASKVEACDAEIRPGVDPSGQLEALKAVTADVISQGKLVEDISKVGQELIAILEELDCKDTPKAKEIQNTVDHIRGMFDAIQETTVDKQHRLNSAIVQSQDAIHNLDALIEWVTETEALFDNIRPVSLDRAALNEQIQAHRVISSDIDNHRSQIDSVVEVCRGRPGCHEKINSLLDRFDALISRAQERGNELEDIVEKLGTFTTDVNQLQSWMANAVNTMKRDSSEYEPSSLKNKIENRYHQKQAKQEDLNKIKQLGRELIENPHTGDKNKVRETLADTQGKWHDLIELLVQMMSFSALREIDDLLKYLDKAESEINTAEPISTDPETLGIQLRDHKLFHDDLESKRRAVNETIDKCNKMLRETTNEEADDIKNKLSTIRCQADLVCKLSAERLALLEEALPLASHFSETHADLQSWLGEIEAEVQSLNVPPECNAEQVRKQQDSAKVTQRIIEDHKPLVQDLKNTGLELMELCTDEDASDLKEDLDNITQKYDDVKSAIRERLNQLDEAFRSVTSDVVDTIDGLLEELHYLRDQTEHADSIAASPDILQEQIAENNAIIDDLERRQMALRHVKELAAAVLEQETPENAEECEDLRSKLHDLDSLTDDIRHRTQAMGAKLEETLGVAEKFQQDQQMALQILRDLQDNLYSQDSPGIDPSTIKEQQRELQAIEQELANAERPISECQKTGERLASLCGVSGQTEIEKVQDDLDTLLEEISDGIKERKEELDNTLDKAERYDQTLEAINSWLPQAEAKFANMSKIAADLRSAKIQIEELKVFKVQVHPHYVDIQNLIQYCSDLKNASPLTAESVLGPQVKEVNTRWNNLLKAIQDREKSLHDALIEMGEVDHAMDDVIGFLQQTETELQALDDIYGDPRYIETYLKKIQMTQKDLHVQDRCIQKLNRAVDALVERSGGRSSPLLEKQQEMNEMFKTVNILAWDKHNQLQETLKEVKAFMGDVEDILRWLSDFRVNIKTSGPMGALPETAQKQFDKYMAEYNNLAQKEEEVRMLLLNGEDMLARCHQQDAHSLRDNLSKLQTKMYDTRNKAERKRVKMEQHLENVCNFHSMLKVHTDWLSKAEKILMSFKHPSKLVDRILVQIQNHTEFRNDIEAHQELMVNLDRTGTFLKYFGRKQDTVYIKNLLISIKLRWKKLVRRTDEKGRLLQQAYKEDKRFYDAWRSLCDWLDESETRMKKYASSTPAKVKQDIDELRMFQHQLSAKHPVYYTTMRLGRSLKDRCTKSDPERETLHSMLEELKNRWNIIRSIVAQKQNKLDEALLSSGRLADALRSLSEWLEKAESYVSEDQPILGDLDTVSLLIEQHKAFQQELDSRQSVFMAMQASQSNDSSIEVQLDELNALWTRVNQLSEVRQARLQEALKLAEDFNDAVQVVREWLPHAEAELKFRALPEDEEAIGVLIEQHEKFMEELRAQQPNLEKINFLAEEILQACHPNAIRFVKYYLTITQTRWEQALNRAEQRSQRLQEALRNIRGNAALLEELLAQLTEAQALLATKEKDPIPEDLTVVEALVKEHLEFHEDLSNKNKDVERLTKTVNTALKKQLHGSAWKLNESDTPSPRVVTLQNKWRTVWRMSVDRKKKLQDALDHLLELESFKNFDFDLWRQRYVSWIRAKKFRITDFFRRQDKDQDGALTRTEFVDGMLQSKFPTNKTELNAVFDIFDRDHSGTLDYKEFVDALKPDRGTRPRGGKRPITDAELIHDEIEQQISHCQCRHQFQVQKVGEGKYKFGEKGKMYLVRFLNSTVMVRVGGGWVTLQEFLQTNDPCRAKGRTNTELHEQFNLPDGVSQTRAMFMSRRRSSQPSNTNSTTPGLKTPRRTTPASSDGRRTPTTARSTNGRTTPTGRRTPTGAVTPTGSRSRSPGRTPTTRPTNSARSTPTPKSSSTGPRPSVGSRTPNATPKTPSGSRTPAGSRTPTGSRTPQGQRSRSPARNESSNQHKMASASRTMKF